LTRFIESLFNLGENCFGGSALFVPGFDVFQSGTPLGDCICGKIWWNAVNQLFAESNSLFRWESQEFLHDGFNTGIG